MTDPPTDNGVLPEDWLPWVDADLALDGYFMWRASDFRHMPTPDDVLSQNDDWRNSLFLLHKIARKLEAQKRGD